jgi:hypothetical protein
LDGAWTWIRFPCSEIEHAYLSIGMAWELRSETQGRRCCLYEGYVFKARTQRSHGREVRKVQVIKRGFHAGFAMAYWVRPDTGRT